MSLTAVIKPDAAPRSSSTPPAPDAEPATGGKKKKILILVALLLVLGGAAYWFVLKPTPETGPKAGKVVALEPIQINLSGEHYLRIGVALQLTDTATEADGSKALDATIDEFSGRSMAEVTSPMKRRTLKKALEKELDHLYEGEVMGVYFTEFVTQ